MIDYVRTGFSTAVARPGLAGIVYAFNLTAALIVAVPLAVAVGDAIGPTGYGSLLVREFDMALWADMWQESGAAFRSVFSLFFWILPFWIVWKTAAAVGIIHAVGRGGGRSFWDGVGRHTGRALLVALLFIPVLIGVFIAAFLIGLLVTLLMGGEAGTFWAWFVVTPLFVVLGLALVDMMQDFARTELVLARQPVVKAWLAGIAWPFRHSDASSVYTVWFLSGLILLAAGFLADLGMSGIWTAFVVQQLLFYVRSAVTVGWIGSEVALFERIEEARNPVLADTAEMAV